MKNNEIIIAGFGGQGILFSGKLLAYTGLVNGYEISWLPSYGPEMRGGTANCHVILSEEPVASPLVTKPTALIAMNLPSLKKFENAVVPGGVILIDNSLIDATVERTDVTVISIPATRMADEIGAKKLANMIMTGAFVKATGCTDFDGLMKGLEKCVPAGKADLLALNKKVLKMGYTFGE
ncbi:MAG: 2-oxoacid:acceptor oxidoreductase family protein [Clostridia bacterium]|nr:2-oxoacid:acceptor oxidoreductase family protein [Clostridia bacterium]